MQVITKITRQKNRDRYNIYVNEKFAFSVDESILIKFGLTKGKILDSFEIDEIAYEDEISKAFNRALNYLSYQMRSEYEIKKKLLDAGFGESVALEAIQKLKRLGFLNDETYSKALLETKKRTAKKGPMAIKQDLLKKGIDQNILEKTLETYTFEEQLRLARQLAEKTVKMNPKKTPAQIKQKIRDLLLRKGYSFEIANEILDQIDLERDDDEWHDLISVQGEKVWNKYAGKYKDKQLELKVKQALYQKGFPLEIIERFIDEKRENE
ncbi:recombination regulator RecX [Ureibacillus sp. FSL K6-8385]|uniref:recombination regulator RecX n=1 Tax=Ureibacillus TaxID=160795 RepID=UPI002E21B12A|nr:recombination regulator RecX [Ureibacillus terrenus]